MPRLALATIDTIFAACLVTSARVSITGSCSCTMPITTPLADLLRPPNPLIGPSLYRVTPSSAGAPRRLRVGEQVAIMMPSVST